MKKLIVIIAASLIAASSATAQTSDSSGSSDSGRFSVQTGVGFYADDDWDGFLWSADGLYHFDRHWSIGLEMHVGVEDDLTIFSMPVYGRYDSPGLPVENKTLAKLRAFAKTGIGFTYAEIDTRGRDDDDTGFLYMIGGGIAFPFNDHFSIESALQFNVTTNDYFDDDFYFSWQLVGLRYRF
jgi:opacity protein-like surface antigen